MSILQAIPEDPHKVIPTRMQMLPLPLLHIIHPVPLIPTPILLTIHSVPIRLIPLPISIILIPIRQTQLPLTLCHPVHQVPVIVRTITPRHLPQPVWLALPIVWTYI
jgi:hypothetical protein